MKGTMSELELSLFRQRSQEALRQMARRARCANTESISSLVLAVRTSIVQPIAEAAACAPLMAGS
jgi:hypothetical protein